MIQGLLVFSEKLDKTTIATLRAQFISAPEDRLPVVGSDQSVNFLPLDRINNDNILVIEYRNDEVDQADVDSVKKDLRETGFAIISGVEAYLLRTT